MILNKYKNLKNSFKNNFNKNNTNLLNFNKITSRYFHSKIKINLINLFTIQKKGIFNKLKGYYKDDKIPPNVNRKTNWVELENPISFENKRYLIIETEPTYKKSILLLKNRILDPLSLITGTASLWFLYNKRIFSTIFFSLLFLLFSKLSGGIKINNKKVIDKIYLLENGTEVEIETLDIKFITDIKNVRKLEIEEGINLKKNFDNVYHNYVPINIQEQLYLIPKSSITKNREILNAISNGRYIKLDDTVEIEESIEFPHNNKKTKKYSETIIDIDVESHKEEETKNNKKI